MTMFADSGSARLAYEVTGAGGSEVLLIYAGVTDRRSWAPLTGVLAPAHRCVSYDARAFGVTTYAAEPFSPGGDALSVLDAVGSGRAAVVGASRGGGTAIDLVLQQRDWVSALVLIGSAVSGAPQSDEIPAELATPGAAARCCRGRPRPGRAEPARGVVVAGRAYRSRGTVAAGFLADPLR